MKRIGILLASLLLLLNPLLTIGCGGGSTTQPSPTPPPPTSQAPISTPKETPSPVSSISPTPPVASPTPTTSPSPSPTQASAVIVWKSPASPVTLTVNEPGNRATYQSGGTAISGYLYKPQGSGPFPAVMVLHGRDGLGESHRSFSSWLAGKGYVAFAPDYLTPIGVAPGAWAGTDYQKHTDRIREDLGQGIEALKSVPYVNPKAIGVAGFSLGGYYAFILATRGDLKGIISYYGAYFGKPVNQFTARYTFAEIVNEVKAPVLMFHGDKDALVPVTSADTVSSLMKTAGKECDYVMYPGVGHAFDPKITQDADTRTLTFFKEKLK